MAPTGGWAGTVGGLAGGGPLPILGWMLLLLLAAGPAASQLMAAAAESEEALEARCKRPPVWSIGGGGVVPMTERLGSVVVLALLKAS